MCEIMDKLIAEANNENLKEIKRLKTELEDITQKYKNLEKALTEHLNKKF